MNQAERWAAQPATSEKRTMASQLEARVREDIINGRLAPGSRLRLEGPERLMKPEWEKAHEAFHQALIANCRSPWLLRLSHMLRDQTARYRMLSVHYTGANERDVPGEHRELLDAALARDVDKACALLAEHYQTTTRSVLTHQALQG